MIEKTVQSQILSEFDGYQATYQDFTKKFSELVQRILSESSVIVHSVTQRVKTRESLLRKLSIPDKGYTSLADLTDIAAIRITTYFSNDVDRVAAIIRDEFEVIDEQSSDKRISLDPNRFGYQSLHYIAKLTEARSVFVEYRRFKDLKVEIQIRSILQHAWAEIEHDLGYKSATGIPRDIRRRFARVAGLLELADAEFEGIRASLNEYAGHVALDIKTNPGDVELNMVSLRALYKFQSSVGELDAPVAQAMDCPLREDLEGVRESLLVRLTQLGVNRVDQLEQLAALHKDTIVNFASYWSDRRRKASKAEADDSRLVRTGIGLFYLLYVLLWQSQDREKVLRHFSVNKIGAARQHAAWCKKLLAFTE